MDTFLLKLFGFFLKNLIHESPIFFILTICHQFFKIDILRLVNIWTNYSKYQCWDRLDWMRQCLPLNKKFTKTKFLKWWNIKFIALSAIGFIVAFVKEGPSLLVQTMENFISACPSGKLLSCLNDLQKFLVKELHKNTVEGKQIK